MSVVSERCILENILSKLEITDKYVSIGETEPSIFGMEEVLNNIEQYINEVKEKELFKFAMWYDNDVFPERGYAQASVYSYLASIEEDKQ